MKPKFSIGERVYIQNINNSQLYDIGTVVGIQESGFWILKKYTYLVDYDIVRNCFRSVTEDKLWKLEVTNED